MDYQRLYESIINNRKMHPYAGYTEIHHIVPKSLGGSDSSDNLVRLTAREHFICHYLLVKIHNSGPSHFKMIRAFLMMLVEGNNQKRYIPSKRYEFLREKHASYLSTEYSGPGNSQFGTKWISNPTTGVSIKISKIDNIPDGYFLGRNLKWKTCTSCHTQHVSVGKLCQTCKKSFKDRYNNKTKKERTFVKPKRTRVEKTCPSCGSVFMTLDNTYCSLTCSKVNGNAAVARSVVDNLENSFNTLTEAAKYHKVTVEAIRYRIKTGKYRYGE